MKLSSGFSPFHSIHSGQLCLEQGPFIDIIATLVFAALVNRTNKKRLLIQRSDANGALYDLIRNISGSAENVLFWSNNQKLLLEGNFKRLKLSSTFGTGNCGTYIIASEHMLMPILKGKLLLCLRRPGAWP